MRGGRSCVRQLRLPSTTRCRTKPPSQPSRRRCRCGCTLAPRPSVVTRSTWRDTVTGSAPGLPEALDAVSDRHRTACCPEIAGTATVAVDRCALDGEGDVDGRAAPVDGLTDDDAGLALGGHDDGEVAQVEPHDGERAPRRRLGVVVGLRSGENIAHPEARRVAPAGRWHAGRGRLGSSRGKDIHDAGPTRPRSGDTVSNARPWARAMHGQHCFCQDLIHALWSRLPAPDLRKRVVVPISATRRCVVS